VCEACHFPLTVKHFLVDCTRYSAARQRYFGVATQGRFWKCCISQHHRLC